MIFAARNGFLPTCLRAIRLTLCASTLLCIGNSVMLALATLAAKKIGWDPALYGALMLTYGSICIITSLLYPLYIHTYKTHISPRLVGGLLCVGAACIMLAPTSTWVWFVCYGSFGVLSTTLFLMCEIHMMNLAPQKERARVLTLYNLAAVAGYMLGPLIASWWGMGAGVFVLAMFAFVGAGLALRGTRDDVIETEKPSLENAKLFVARTPFTWLMSVLAGIAGLSVSAFLGVFGLGIGLQEGEAIRLMTYFMLGAFVLQYPLSFMMDHMPKRQFVMIMLGVAMGVTGALFVTQNMPTGVFVANVVVWGGVCFTLAITGFALISEQFTGSERVYALALHAIFYDFGNLIGPLAIGAGMSAIGANGLLYTFIGVLAVAALVGFLSKQTPPSTAVARPIWGSHGFIALPFRIKKKKK